MVEPSVEDYCEACYFYEDAGDKGLTAAGCSHFYKFTTPNWPPPYMNGRTTLV